MIYNNVEYLSLPQQVEKNKDDIAQLKTDTAKVIYGDTDVLPTPGVGTANTYLVVADHTNDEPLLDISIGSVLLVNPTIVVVSNVSGELWVFSNPSSGGSVVPNLTVSTQYIKLLNLI